MQVAPNGCTGNCCERFVLPHNIEYINQNFELWKKKQNNEPLPEDSPLLHPDIDIIAPMLIPLDDGKALDWNPSTGHKLENGKTLYHYTCKHFNKENRLCNIHETKPKMCSDYNYGDRCDYEGCEFIEDCNKIQQKESNINEQICNN